MPKTYRVFCTQRVLYFQDIEIDVDMAVEPLEADNQIWSKLKEYDSPKVDVFDKDEIYITSIQKLEDTNDN